MTTEREEALELAREAGARITKVLDCLPPFHYFEMSEIDLEALVRLAKQRGAEEEREECAKVCLDKRDGWMPKSGRIGHFSHAAASCAVAIRMRAMKKLRNSHETIRA